MKPKSILSTGRFKYSFFGSLILSMLFGIAFIPTGCKDETAILPNTKESVLTYRDGEPLSTRDVLELLGDACVPGSIHIGTGCNDIEYLDTMQITLPGYTGCTFTIVWKYYLCAAGGLLDYTMSDFQIISHNCSAFSTAFNSAITTGGSTLTTFITNTELAIYNQLEAALIAQYVPTGTYPCLQGLFFNIIFIKASCYYNCIIEYQNGSSSYVKVACGVDCCERHTRVCRNAQGNLYTEVEYVHPDGIFCEDPPDFEDNPVLELCTRQTNCSYKCP